MVYVNDNFEIPEEYRKMSASEIRIEKEKVYEEHRKIPTGGVRTDTRKGNIKFFF